MERARGCGYYNSILNQFFATWSIDSMKFHSRSQQTILCIWNAHFIVYIKRQRPRIHNAIAKKNKVGELTLPNVRRTLKVMCSWQYGTGGKIDK
jgi:hypothetical protein